MKVEETVLKHIEAKRSDLPTSVNISSVSIGISDMNLDVVAGAKLEKGKNHV